MEGKIKSFGVGSSYAKIGPDEASIPSSYRVFQFEHNPLAGVNLDAVARHGRLVFTHSALSGLRHVAEALSRYPELVCHYRAELDVDVTNPNVLPGLLLAYSRSINPNGKVIFSTRSRDHLVGNVSVFREIQGWTSDQFHSLRNLFTELADFVALGVPRVLTDLNERRPQRFTGDVCIVGTGAAGLTLGSVLLRSGASVIMLESGGLEEEREAELLNRCETGRLLFEGAHRGRKRVLGGATQCWGGQLRPLEPIDFAFRPWVDHSGWPITGGDLATYYCLALKFAGSDGLNFDSDVCHALGRESPFDEQVLRYYFSKWSPHPRFREVLADDLRESESVRVFLHANVTRLELGRGADHIEEVRACNAWGEEFPVCRAPCRAMYGGHRDGKAALGKSPSVAEWHRQRQRPGRTVLSRSSHLARRDDSRCRPFADREVLRQRCGQRSRDDPAFLADAGAPRSAPSTQRLGVLMVSLPSVLAPTRNVPELDQAYRRGTAGHAQPSRRRRHAGRANDPTSPRRLTRGQGRAVRSRRS